MNPPERLILFACAAYCFLGGIVNFIDWLAERRR
jgi:hypothetical protein